MRTTTCKSCAYYSRGLCRHPIRDPQIRPEFNCPDHEPDAVLSYLLKAIAALEGRPVEEKPKRIVYALAPERGYRLFSLEDEGIVGVGFIDSMSSHTIYLGKLHEVGYAGSVEEALDRANEAFRKDKETRT